VLTAQINTVNMATNNVATMEKPAPKDMSHQYSRVTKNRVASKIKQFYKYFAIPGIGNLAGGKTMLQEKQLSQRL
jgi:site-specific recombinase XerD